MYVAHIVKDTS